ncbi:hypothetical protein M9H77_35377 [Catharanthus roseus]|uniref:Uncharacterized protein n=1 Tax=Catharanthus roseus TaxID=4058 RepID=A0ACB9ZNU1_CATRO|nr:hypothetical protein M9H77_35377 [Catharanthus roseus]
MDATSSLLSSSSGRIFVSSSNSHFNSSSSYTTSYQFPRFIFSVPRVPASARFRISTSLLRPSALVIEDEVVNDSAGSISPSSPKEMLPRIDKSGRFCSPRAARELALLILYASCIEGSDPVRLFEKRINAKREPGYQFDKELLVEYNHMSFGGPPITTDTVEQANELLSNYQKESEMEAEVLSAPPKLVYSKLILRFTRKLLVAVAENWDNHVIVIDNVAPDNWKEAKEIYILIKGTTSLVETFSYWILNSYPPPKVFPFPPRTRPDTNPACRLDVKIQSQGDQIHFDCDQLYWMVKHAHPCVTW